MQNLNTFVPPSPADLPCDQLKTKYSCLKESSSRFLLSSAAALAHFLALHLMVWCKLCAPKQAGVLKR